MNRTESALRELHAMDTLASREQWINRVHPLAKLAVTVLYIALVVSFSAYDVIGVSGMVLYPFALFQLAELSFRASLRRLRLVLPLVCFVGLLNPLLDHTVVTLGGVTFSAGVLSMLTLMMKGVFSVLASYLLIATTTIESLCHALRLLRVPKALVTQLLLTCRYLSVLLGETNRLMQAYSLRAPGQTGIHFRVWGSLVGQLLLRSVDRANTVYESMVLRGYRGEFSYSSPPFRRSDLLYLLCWALLLALFRRVPVFLLVGRLIGGGF